MGNTQLIDSHSHIDFSEFDVDRVNVINRAMIAGVTDVIVSSTQADRWQLIKNICDENSLCHPAYGLHPMFMNEHRLNTGKISESVNSGNDIDRLKYFLEKNHAIAIGEIGLDFIIKEADEKHRKAQLELFISQLEIATEMQLPVIIHARKSLDIILKYLRKFPKVRGSIHSFSGSTQQAKQLIDLGFYLGFGGPITYNRATRLQQLIKDLPLDALLVETDSPDQPDSSHHLQRNEPAYIVKVVEKIAELKLMEVESISRATTENAMKLFNLGNN